MLIVEWDAKIALEASNYGYVMRTGKVAPEGRDGELLGNEEVKRIYPG